MPRNSSGTYSLPAGNPVVTGTVISSTWANTTLSDIGNEITQSLDRSGDGGMLAGLQLADGLVGAPGLTWGTEPTSGLYRAGAGDFRYSISSTDRLQLTASLLKAVVTEFELEAAAPMIHIDETDGGANQRNWLLYSTAGVWAIGTATDAAPTTPVANAISFTRSGTTVGVGASAVTQMQWGDGTVGSPVFSFSADTDTGLFRSGANSLNLVAGGASTLLVTTAGTYALDGSAGSPSISFASDTNTGIYRPGADQIGISCGGALIALSTTTTFGLNTGIQLIVPDGSAAAPAYSFGNDTDTGLYRPSANTLILVTNGVGRVALNTALFQCDLPFGALAGSVGSPSYTFTSDLNTGLYNSASDRLTITAGGTAQATFGGGAMVMEGTTVIYNVDASAASPAYTFTASTTTGMFHAGSGRLAFSAGGAAYLSFGNGIAYILTNQTTASTVGAAGGASALPATPLGYWQVSLNGSNVKIPYYNT